MSGPADVVRISLGTCYDAAVVSEGDRSSMVHSFRSLIIDWRALRAWAAERVVECGEDPTGEGRLLLEVQHNGLTDGDCQECGGGGLELELFLERTTTIEERRAYDEARALEAAAARRRREKREAQTLRRLAKKFPGRTLGAAAEEAER